MMLIRWPFTFRRRIVPPHALRAKPAVWWRPLGLQAREFVCAPWCRFAPIGPVGWPDFQSATEAMLEWYSRVDKEEFRKFRAARTGVCAFRNAPR
jgi:hypothetical protein